jgi:ABC-type polysaccharide/polyol phosphate export permease
VKPYYSHAWHDFVDGMFQWRIWTRLGWQEVKRRYRRTVLGPFWATLGIGMFIGGMVFIWAPLFKTSVTSYLPYLTAGMVSWTFIVALITEGGGTYTAGFAIITSLNFPFTILNFMVIWRNLIVFFHNIVIVVLVVAVLPIPVNWSTLLVIPGVLIVAANGIWITMLLGMVSARFRDIPPLVGNLTTILMFVTPVFWMATQLGPRAQTYIKLNYVYHLIEIMRQPMLGQTPPLVSYAVTILGALVGSALTIMIYARFRRRIPYWL